MAGIRVPGPRAILITAAAVVVALVLVVGVLAYRLGGAATAADQPTPTPSPTQSGPPTTTQIYQTAGPSVVVIRTAGGLLGTGVVAAQDGTILTADHVVADGTTITVTFSDGTNAQASVASADPADDIATLTPASLPKLLVPAVIGGAADVGAPVVAIGNPLGLTYSVSTGVVAGLDREASTDQGEFSGLIQFDASVNPGSSGGPLLDQSGSVIGIVVSIADPGHDDAWAGVGFAVPIGAALGGGPGDGQGPQI